MKAHLRGWVTSALAGLILVLPTLSGCGAGGTTTASGPVWGLPFKTGTRVTLGSLGLHDDNFGSMPGNGFIYHFGGADSTVNNASFDVLPQGSSVPVIPLASGTVLAIWPQCHLVVVDHGNGVWVEYLHIVVNVTSGEQVTRDTTLGTTTTSVSTGEPCREKSEGPNGPVEHVHFAFLQAAPSAGSTVPPIPAGTFQPMVNRVLCGYQVIQNAQYPIGALQEVAHPSHIIAPNDTFTVPDCPSSGEVLGASTTAGSAPTVSVPQPQLDIHHVHGVVTQADALVATTAQCLSGEVLLGGGAKVDGTLFSSYPSARNAWTAEGSGLYGGQGVDAWALCISGVNDMSTTIAISSSVPIANGGDAREVCPSGSVLVGGGFRISPPPAQLFGPEGAFTVIVAGSTPMIGNNGWDVFAFGDSNEHLVTYALCSQNGFSASAIFTASASVNPGRSVDVTDSCPGSSILVSGGGADLTTTSVLSMSLEGSLPLANGTEWDYRPYDYQDAVNSHTGQVYIVCAHF